MFERELVVEYLDQILEAVERIERRSMGIECSADFESTPEGVDRLDGICMMLIAIGENLKKVDSKTDGKLLPQYPPVPWGNVKRTRDVISHGYFEVDVDVIFDICKNRLTEFADTVRRMRDDVASGLAP